MGRSIKKKLYFWGASYFAFWARIKLKKWQPLIIVVTGSVGKTTVFYFLEAQLKKQAEFAYKSNSAYGIPFNILNLKRENFGMVEMLKLILLAPMQIFKREQRKKIYVVEADVDRPHEGRFLARLLKPNMVLVTNIYNTHAMNFDQLIKDGDYKNVTSLIAGEFMNFVKEAKEQVWLNGDNLNLVKAIDLLGVEIEEKKKIDWLQEADYLNEYNLSTKGTHFVINKIHYDLPYILPKEVALGLAMTEKVVKELKLRIDESYQNLSLPAGRSTVLEGIKNTTLIDSSYNANVGSMTALLNLFELYPAEKKWLVLGHMLEQGHSTQSEHEKIAALIVTLKTIEKVFLIGASNKKWMLPILERFVGRERVNYFEQPKKALQTIKEQIEGGEVILLKGAPFMEGMVEGLLADPRMAQKLVRREAVWQKRRENFYGQS